MISVIKSILVCEDNSDISFGIGIRHFKIGMSVSGVNDWRFGVVIRIRLVLWHVMVRLCRVK